MSRSSPCHPFLHSVMQSAISSDMNHMQPGLKSRDRDLGVIRIHIWRDHPNPGPNSCDLGVICIHLCRDHPNPGPKSGRRITGGGSYVTVCLVTLTTIPLARISPFPLVPSNAGIICSNSASASLVSFRPSIPAGHVDITSYVTTCQNWRSTAARGASLSNHLLWNITSTSLFRFSRFSYPSYRELP